MPHWGTTSCRGRRSNTVLSISAFDEAFAPWLQNSDRRNRRRYRDDRSSNEYTIPITVGRQYRGQRNQQGCGAFCGVQRTGVTGGELHTEGIGANGWEDRENFAPEQEHQCGKRHESNRIVTVFHQTEHRQAFTEENDEHGIFAT